MKILFSFHGFSKEVIARSEERPVVVDFWAPWCGPCKVLGPIIEELAESQSDQWSLVKVNTDDDPELSTQYKIKGIPAVKMFHCGEVIAEFTGALPKHKIEEWLETHLPDERKDQLNQLRERFLSGQDITDELELFLEANDLDEGRLLLAQVLVFSDPEKSRTLIESLKSQMKYAALIEDLRALVDFMTCDLSSTGLADQIGKAREQATTGNFDAALEDLISVVMIDKNFCNEMPRRATIGLFHLLGDQHELTRKHRRRFDMALY